ATGSRSYGHSTCAKQHLQAICPFERRTRTTTVQIEGCYSGFWKCVASKVRFAEQVQPGDSARLRELMPHRLVDHAQIEIADDLFTNSANGIDIAKKLRRAFLCVHQPRGSLTHDLCDSP